MSEAHKNIIREIKLLTINKNESIYEQGDHGNSFFFILSGTIDIFGIEKNNENEDCLNISEKEVFFFS